MPVVWIASYPKSGNTWVRFLLSAYFFDAVVSWDAVAQIVLEFPPLLARAKKEGLSDLQLWQQLVELKRQRPAVPPGFPEDLFLKTHHAATEDHPFLNRARKAVVLVRNPRDVALSAFNFLRLKNRRPISDEKAYLKEFLRHGGDPSWKQIGFGTWLEHTNSWLAAHHFPAHLVRYEDLHVDPAREFEGILRFLDAPIDRERIARAIQQADFRNLKRLEVQRRDEGHLFPGHAERLFMNKGRVQNSLAEIDRKIDRDFESEFQEGLRQFGYAA
jgi:hypothetical protein